MFKHEKWWCHHFSLHNKDVLLKVPRGANKSSNQNTIFWNHIQILFIEVVRCGLSVQRVRNDESWTGTYCMDTDWRHSLRFNFQLWWVRHTAHSVNLNRNTALTEAQMNIRSLNRFFGSYFCTHPIMEVEQNILLAVESMKPCASSLLSKQTRHV